MGAAILNLAILDSAILQNLWFKIIQSDSKSFILIQLDYGCHLHISHLGFRHCHLGFRHLVILSQFHWKTFSLTLILTQTNSIWLTWWWQPSWILSSWILPSWIQPFYKTSDSNKFNLTQTYSFWLNLMMAAILNSAILDSDTAILDSDTLLSSLRFTQKHSHSLWFWFKLIQSD